MYLRVASSLVAALCLLGLLLWNGNRVPPAEAMPSAQVGPTPDCRTIGPLKVCLETDKPSYFQGEPVQMTLEITALESVSGWHQTTCEYDFGVDSPSAQEVWHYLYLRACGQIVWPLTLGAGETLTYSTTWDQKDDSGEQVPPGTYLAWGKGSFCLDAPLPVCDPMSVPVPVPISIASSSVSADPVGGVAEPPDVIKPKSGSSSFTHGAPAGIAAAVIILGVGTWYARRRLLQ